MNRIWQKGNRKKKKTKVKNNIREAKYCKAPLLVESDLERTHFLYSRGKYIPDKKNRKQPNLGWQPPVKYIIGLT